MLDFVEAKFHALRCNHVGGDVAADAQAVFVRFVNNYGNEFGLDRAVHFDLDVAELDVIVDGRSGFSLGGG